MRQRWQRAVRFDRRPTLFPHMPLGSADARGAAVRAVRRNSLGFGCAGRAVTDVDELVRAPEMDPLAVVVGVAARRFVGIDESASMRIERVAGGAAPLGDRCAPVVAGDPDVGATVRLVVVVRIIAGRRSGQDAVRTGTIATKASREAAKGTRTATGAAHDGPFASWRPCVRILFVPTRSMVPVPVGARQASVHLHRNRHVMSCSTA